MNSRPFLPRSERGSVLLVCLIFAAVIAISLGSFLQIAGTASRLSYRTYYLGAAMNIAETGLEEATWSMNQDDQGKSGAWNGWTAVGSSYTRSFTLDKLEGGATAVVKVHATPATPRIVLVRAIVTPPQGAPIEKYLKVKLTKRSLFSIGGLGRDGISISGNNVVMGSWNSNPDKDDTTPYIPFSEAVANDAMSLASVKVTATIGVGQGDVNGSVAVGADSSADGFEITDYVIVGTNGFVGPEGTPPGTLDPDSVSADFTADLQVVGPPEDKTYTAIGSIGSDYTLPRPGDSAAADGYHYYSTSGINLTNSTLSITPGSKVVLVVSNNGNLSVGGGSGSINIGGAKITNTSTNAVTYESGSLEIYVSGDVAIAGKGASNTVTTQTYTPASSTNFNVTTKTEISNVTDIYGKGQQKNTVIGWTYKQTVTTTSTPVSGGAPTVNVSGPTTYQRLIVENPTKPVAGIVNSGPVLFTATSPAITTDTGSIPGQPQNFRIYGTRSDEDAAKFGNQSIKISGNGSLSGVVYAPNGDIEAKGGGNSGFIHGSLVGASLKFTGNDCFYYDESLADLDDDPGFKFESWEEFNISNIDETEKDKLAF